MARCSDMENVLVVGLTLLQKNKGGISYQKLTETAPCFAGVIKNAAPYVENSVVNADGVGMLSEVSRPVRLLP